MSATDQDSGTDGVIEYTIQAGNEGGGFAVDSDGSLTVAKKLDRETKPVHTLTVFASDSPTVGAPKFSTVTIVIALSDVNDNAPVFTTQECHTFVSDDAAVTSKVLTVSATDADIGRNAELQYVLQTSDAVYFDNFFTFDQTSGFVRVKKDLDLDKQSLSSKDLSFTVQANDQGSPSLSSKLNCTMSITGENKYAPTLSHDSVVAVVIPNDSTPGYRVTLINATDGDFGPDGEISYRIAEGNSENVFSILSNGQVNLVKIPTTGFSYLTVTLSDKASQAKRRSTTCILAVYFLGETIPAGNIYIGNVHNSGQINSVSSEIVVPVFVQSGLRKLEGFDVSILFDSAAVSFHSANSGFNVVHTESKVRIVGVVGIDSTTFGVLQIAELKFNVLKQGLTTMTPSVFAMLDQAGKYIPPSAAPTPSDCTSVIFADVNRDCLFNIVDIAFAQSYVREKRSGFRSDHAATFASITSEQRQSLDANQNGMIDGEDVTYMMDVMLAHSVAVKSVKVEHPGSTKDQCLFKITVDIHDSITLPTSFSLFAAITYTNAPFTSNPHVETKIASFSLSSGVLKYGDVVPLTKADASTYVFSSEVSTLASDLGVTVLVVATSETSHVTTMFSKVTGGETKMISLTNSNKFNVSSNYAPQIETALPETSYRCRNPLALHWMGIRFAEDYDVHVKGREVQFKQEFKTFYETYELLYYNRTVSVLNITVRKGSIVVEHQIQLLESHRSDLIEDLVRKIQDGGFTFTFNSTVLTPVKTLLIDGTEQVKQPTETDDKDGTVVAIVVVLVFLLLLILVIVICICYRKRFRRRGDAPTKAEILEEENSPEHLKPKARSPSPVYTSIVMGEMKSPVTKSQEEKYEERQNSVMVENGVTNSSFSLKDESSVQMDDPAELYLSDLSAKEKVR